VATVAEACKPPARRGPNKGLPATGMDAGYHRHRRAGETPCDPCREAHNMATRLWAVANPEYEAERVRIWDEANPGRKAERNRRSYEANREKVLERSYVIALARGGIHCLSNLRPACKSCNCSKGAKAVA
jgi:hypothetical protein